MSIQISTTGTGTDGFRLGAIAPADIVFQPLSANEWRVSDSRFPRQSIEALLGFVAQKGASFYATRMNHPLESSSFGSLEQVAAFFAAPDSSPSWVRRAASALAADVTPAPSSAAGPLRVS